MNAKEVVKELEEVLRKHNASLTSDNMGDLILEINNKFVAFGSAINGYDGRTHMTYMD